MGSARSVLSVCCATIAWSLCASGASAQIISAAIPRTEVGGGEGKEKSWALHVMVSPLARWRYAELYVEPSADGFFGTIGGAVNSDLMAAGELVIGRAEGWSIGLGGWYNRLGSRDVDFEGLLLSGETGVAVEGVFETELTVVEGHAAVFYKGFGVQAGVVKTLSEFGRGRIVRLGGEAVRFDEQLSLRNGDTIDVDVFAVYKTRLAEDRVTLAVGAGAYRKQGETTGAALRLSDAKTVATGFASAGVRVFKGFSLDASFWYLAPTDAQDEFNVPEDSATRLTLGVGYTF